MTLLGVGLGLLLIVVVVVCLLAYLQMRQTSRKLQDWVKQEEEASRVLYPYHERKKVRRNGTHSDV